MPELPEVESIRRALEPIVGARVVGVSVHRRDVVILTGDPPGGWTRQRKTGTSGGRGAHAPDLSPGVGPAQTSELAGALLEGARICALDRRGKQLAIGSTSGRAAPWLTVQLGMTGQMLILPTSERPTPPPSGRGLRGGRTGTHSDRGARSGSAGAQRAPFPFPLGGGSESDSRPPTDGSAVLSLHDHVAWSLELSGGGAATLVFRDPRRFGCVRGWASREALDDHWSRELGPDALETSVDELSGHLWRVLRPSRRPLKAALLDQAVVAGVGNIYADEALFEAGVKPRKRTDRLTRAEIDRLAASVRRVLGRAVKAGGSTLRDYVRPDGSPGSYQLRHAVYGRAGQACPRCTRPLSSATIAQRTTVWCPRCQK